MLFEVPTTFTTSEFGSCGTTMSTSASYFACIALIVAFAVIAFAVAAFARHRLTATEARAHIGQTATVCGEVVSTRFASSTRGRPTFLNLDKP